MTTGNIGAEEFSQMVAAAREALTRAYSPYSRLRVGAAVLTKNGGIYSGCNVENASYGLTVCAERVAVYHAVVAEGADMRIRAVAVVSDRPGNFPPCGACRQVINEFGPEAVIVFQGPEGLKEMLISELLPACFRLA